MALFSILKGASSSTAHHNRRYGAAIVLFLVVSALYFLDALTKSVTLVNTSMNGCMVDLETTALFNVPRKEQSQPVNNDDPSFNATTPTLFHSPVRFVFFIGLEGTGHHLLKGIVSQSPAVDRLRQLNIHYDLTIPLQESLHHEKHKNGLFNVHCQLNQETINATEIQGRVVGLLQQINQRALMLGKDGTLPEGTTPRRTDDGGFTHPSPITALPINTLQASSSSGEMSYPNYHGECRKLNFPNMDLWYQACQTARVDCQHVYIHRDPYAILKSTTVNRDHNGNHKLAAIHLYTSLQTVILAQLMSWSDQTLGCMGMLDGDDEDDDNNYRRRTENGDWWDTMRIIFGWKNAASFDHNVKNKFYKPRRAMSTHEKEELVPLTLQPYMDSWMRVHEQTIQLCQRQAQQNQEMMTAF